jgi:rhodanese-related sulfurtransferase
MTRGSSAPNARERPNLVSVIPNTFNVLRWLAVVFACMAAQRGSAAPPWSADHRVWLGHTNVGRLTAGSTNLLTLSWLNSTAREAQVGKALPSCDHVRVLDWPTTIAPGAAGQIRAAVVADNPGPFSVAVIIEFRGVNDARQIFGISGWVATPGGLAGRTNALIEPASLISKAEVLREWMVVDVRPTPEFQAVHLLGALNMPLYAVKAQNMLRSRNLLLMGSGIDDERLVNEIPRLAHGGSEQVAVLRGGPRWWQQQGGELSGDTNRVGSISAQSFWAARNTLRWCLVNVSREPGGNTPPDLLGGFPVRFDGDVRTFEEQLRRAGVRVNEYDALLLYGDSGDVPQALAAWGASTRLLPVFMLEGGTAQYAQYCAFQIQMHQRRTLALAQFNPREFLRTFRPTPRGTGCCGNK